MVEHGSIKHCRSEQYFVTPPENYSENAIESALNAGVRVLLERPLALTNVQVSKEHIYVEDYNGNNIIEEDGKVGLHFLYGILGAKFDRSTSTKHWDSCDKSMNHSHILVDAYRDPWIGSLKVYYRLGRTHVTDKLIAITDLIEDGCAMSGHCHLNARGSLNIW